MSENNNIAEIKEEDFEEKVINASKTNLIIVDFWAPWCGPCKQLTPILEKIINNDQKKVKLIKINIDENQQIAGQLRIQSIPAVFAFKDGQPIDAFQGVLPEKKVLEFIEKSLGEKINNDNSDFYEKVSALMAEDNFTEAKDMLENFFIDNPKEFKGFAMYIDCLTSLDEFKEANLFIESLDSEATNDTNIKSSIQKLSIKEKNKQGPSIDFFLNELKNKPKNIDIINKLADKYFAENRLDDAFSLLLNNYKKDTNKIKNKFIEFFDALGNENEFTIKYRKKLSSIMFA